MRVDFVGTSVIPRAEFTRRLGQKATQLWSVLVRLRDHFEGNLHPSLRGIAEAEGASPIAHRSAKRALARLRQAGLVEDLGFRWLRTSHGAVRVYHRRVYGAWAGRESVLVPMDRWPAVMRLETCSHGGKRVGAGKKRNQAAPKNGGVSTGPLEVTRRNQAAPSPPNQAAHRIHLLPSVVGSSLREEPRADARASIEGLKKHFQPMGRALVRAVPGENWIPAYPSAIVGTTPPPPKVPYYADHHTQLAFVERWYTSAVESRFGRQPPVRLSGATKVLFEQALKVFLDEGVAPGAWVAWQVDRLAEARPAVFKPGCRPKVGTVLSLKTLTEHMWMFRDMELDYCCAVAHWTLEARELMNRFKQFVQCAEAIPNRTPEQAKALQAELFPEGYVQLLTEAREKMEVQRQEFRERLSIGEWLWPVKRGVVKRGG